MGSVRVRRRSGGLKCAVRGACGNARKKGWLCAYARGFAGKSECARGIQPIVEWRHLVVFDGYSDSTPTVTITYEPDSPNLIETLTGPAHSVTHTWSPTRNVLSPKKMKLWTRHRT